MCRAIDSAAPVCSKSCWSNAVLDLCQSVPQVLHEFAQLNKELPSVQSNAARFGESGPTCRHVVQHNRRCCSCDICLSALLSYSVWSLRMLPDTCGKTCCCSRSAHNEGLVYEHVSCSALGGPRWLLPPRRVCPCAGGLALRQGSRGTARLRDVTHSEFTVCAMKLLSRWRRYTPIGTFVCAVQKHGCIGAACCCSV